MALVGVGTGRCISWPTARPRRRPGSGLVVIAGEAGVDKSTLVEALRAELDGVRWLTGAPGRSTSNRSIWTPSTNLPGRPGWIRCSAG